MTDHCCISDIYIKPKPHFTFNNSLVNVQQWRTALTAISVVFNKNNKQIINALCVEH